MCNIVGDGFMLHAFVLKPGLWTCSLTFIYFIFLPLFLSFLQLSLVLPFTYFIIEEGRFLIFFIIHDIKDFICIFWLPFYLIGEYPDKTRKLAICLSEALKLVVLIGMQSQLILLW